MVDTTITVLQEHGFDLSRPGLCTRVMSHEQEIEVEAIVTSRAAVAVGGQGTFESYFDRFVGDRTTLTGTTYDLQRGRVRRCDFSVSTKTQRTKEGHLTTSMLPSVLHLDDSELPLIEGNIYVLCYF